MSKKFPTDLADRGTVKITDKLLIHNIDTGVTEYTTVQQLFTALGVAGLKFPAIQIPSTDVNTLDDYKEGTWVPSIKFGGLSVGLTYTDQLGFYTKIGRMVSLICYIKINSNGTSVGNATITGLPYPVGGTHAACSIRINKVTFANMVEGYAGAATSIIYLEEITEAGVVTQLQETDLPDDCSLAITCNYII